MINLREVADRVREEYPVISRGLFPNVATPDDPRWPYAEMALEHVARLAGGDPDHMDRVIEAFAITSLDFIRLQARFYTTGRYARSTADELVADLYGDDEKMSGYYLDGLALTYALWANHVDLLRHFAESFLPALDPGSRLVEVGPGHGLMASIALDRYPESTYIGLDISPSALVYADRAFAAGGADSSRYELVNGDITKVDLSALVGGSADAVVCCEVLEHVDDPGVIVDGIDRVLARDGLAFVSTVANLEADDHVYLFNDADHIRRTLTASGLAIVDEQTRPLQGAEDRTPLPLNYSAVLRHASASDRRQVVRAPSRRLL